MYTCLFYPLIFIVTSPTNVMAVPAGPTSIRVSWTPSTNATGYTISYTGGGSSDSVTVSGGSTDNYLLTGLQNGDTYTISVAAMAGQFTSDSVTPGMAVGLGKCMCVCCTVHTK